MPAGGGAPATGIKEPGTHLPPPVDIKEPGTHLPPPEPPETGIRSP